MKVLDIGSGAGDVAMAAAELVGDDGEVIGVDMNAEILETARARARGAGFANIQFLAGDSRTLDLPNDFDALIGRLVLMYMADPADALKQLKARLRPGAIVAFQEVEFTSISAFYADHTPLDEQLSHVGLLRSLSVQGRIPEWVWTSTVLLWMPVLPEPALQYTAPMGGPEAWGGYQFRRQQFSAVFSRLWKPTGL